MSGRAAEPEQRYALDKPGVGIAFDAVAKHYDRHAFLQSEIAARLAQRLEFMKLEPQRIIDVGCGTGITTKLVAACYRGAQILAVDIAHGMLLAARRKQRLSLQRWAYACADAEALPIRAGSCDLVVSNLMLQWCSDIDGVFQELFRVLRPGGLLLFTSFGPDTLRELRHCWSKVDERVHINAFVDMHDLGDALIRARFSSPVLDVEHLNVTYPDLRSLMVDLKGVGSRNLSHGRHRGLTSKGSWARLCRAYEEFRRDDRLPATYEVVYAHAWAPLADTRPQDGSTVSTFPVHALRGSRRDNAGER